MTHCTIDVQWTISLYVLAEIFIKSNQKHDERHNKKSLELDHFHRKISEGDQRRQRKSFQVENDKILISYVLFLKWTKKWLEDY